MKFLNVNSYRYGYQGEYAEDETGEEGIQANSFQLRLYNPRLGRWMSPDPYGQYHSPYLAMGNNHISIVDPDGGFGAPIGLYNAYKYGGNLSHGIFGSSMHTVGGLTLPGIGISTAILTHLSQEIVLPELTISGAASGFLNTGLFLTTFLTTHSQGPVNDQPIHQPWDETIAIPTNFVPSRIHQARGKGSNKNSPHANQKAREAAQKKLEEATQDLKELKQKPNKTPDDKEWLKKLENLVKRLKEKANFTPCFQPQKYNIKHAFNTTKLLL